MHRTAEMDNPTMPGPARPRENAFTLVELLVAMFIIAILITLVVGVAGYVYEEAARKETQATQNLVMIAVKAFKQATGESPKDENDFSPPPVPREQLLLYQLKGDHLGTNTRDQEMKARIKKATGDTLLEIPPDVMDGTVVRDGFGNAMIYLRQGGLGSRPVVISAGPDEQFDNEDDIRSDEH